MSELRPNQEAELIERIRSIDERAPDELHRRVQALVAERAGGSRGRAGAGVALRWSGGRVPIVGGAIAVAAAAVVVLVLALTGGSSALSVRAVSAATMRASTTPAPREDLRERGALKESVDGVSFPYWTGRFGWRASGGRSDTIDGRTVNTVFYTNARGERIGYAILAGTPAPSGSGGVVVSRHGHPYRVLSEHGVTSVVWLRKGHLCVVAGRGVASTTLLALASWRERAV